MSRQFWLNLPNIITLARILAVPYLVWLVLVQNITWAFWVFVLAGLSDGLDGFLAKRFKLETKVGAFLDPIADKLLLVSAFVVLGMQDFLPLWLVIMVVFRDLAIVVGATLLEILTHNLKISPNFSSKINTTVQIVLASCVFGVHGLEVGAMEMVIDLLIYLTALTTVVSGGIYLYQWGLAIGQENGTV